MTNRERLVESALASLQDKGYADTTARDIASHASVSLGAIGYHFGSTKDLLDAALAEGVRRWLQPLIRTFSEPPTATWAQLAVAMDGLVTTLAGNRPLVIAYFEALVRAERAPELRASLAADFDELRSAVTRGVQLLLADKSESSSPDPKIAASLIMAAFDGMIVQWLLDPQRLPSGAEIAETLRSAAALVSVQSDLASTF